MGKVKLIPRQRFVRAITVASFDEIAAKNPLVDTDLLRIYLDALVLYREASANIEKNGAVTGNPKTCAPMTNPYLSIRESAARQIARFHRENPEFVA